MSCDIHVTHDTQYVISIRTTTYLSALSLFRVVDVYTNCATIFQPISQYPLRFRLVQLGLTHGHSICKTGGAPYHVYGQRPHAMPVSLIAI